MLNLDLVMHGDEDPIELTVTPYAELYAEIRALDERIWTVMADSMMGSEPMAIGLSPVDKPTEVHRDAGFDDKGRPVRNGLASGRWQAHAGAGDQLGARGCLRPHTPTAMRRTHSH